MADDEDPVNKLESNDTPAKAELTPTRIFLRGLAVSLPTIMTIVVLKVVFSFVNDNIITPATATVKYTMSHFVDDSVASSELEKIDGAPPLEFCGTSYLVTKELRERYRTFVQVQRRNLDAVDDGPIQETEGAFSNQQLRRIEWLQLEAQKLSPGIYVQMGPRSVPYHVYADVARHLPPGQVPTSSRAVYMEFVAHKYFRSLFHLSLLTVVLIIIILYFAGQFVSARLGGWVVRFTEDRVLGRLPVVRNIYGSVKQVTDFLFTESQPIEYRRVAAVQYTRKGVWAIGFVTGESMMQISVGAGEPCLSVFIPTSPMPMTGFTINVPKSEVLDLDITVEQAMQFCISCGVLSPPHQKMTPQKYKEYVERGLIRASISTPVYMPGPTRVQGQPYMVQQPDDDESDDE